MLEGLMVRVDVASALVPAAAVVEGVALLLQPEIRVAITKRNFCSHEPDKSNASAKTHLSEIIQLFESWAV
jgi:hypothetical protein